MPQRPDLRSRLKAGNAVLAARDCAISFAALARCHPFTVPPGMLKNANVLIRTRAPLHAALALVALDGIAARLVIAPPGLGSENLADVIDRARIDTVVSDGEAILGPRHVAVSARLVPTTVTPRERETEWVMFTSGATGAPEMKVHSLAALTGAVAQAREKIVWGTFHDIRRYGGLQILLRALIGGASLVLCEPDEPVDDFIARLGAAGVTHLAGTASHWRRALMSPQIASIAPRYLRLSGETADQAVLDGLKAKFPEAALAHDYTSTEPGADIEVTDGLGGGIRDVEDLRINPQEVEAVINRHPGVALSRVSGRRNPVTGAVMVAEVVLSDTANDNATFRDALLAFCREKLPAMQVPAMVRFVERLDLATGGTLVRHG